MKVELFDFQATAAKRVATLLGQARRNYEEVGGAYAIGLAATTGSGKTLMATAVIEAMLAGSEELEIEPDPAAVFLWMTDLPDLNRQTARKMEAAQPSFGPGTIVEIAETFTSPRLEAGRIYFLNTQKLGEGAFLTRRGPQVKRAYNFYDIVRATIEEEPRRHLYLVIDEAHRGTTLTKAQVEEADTIIQRFIFGFHANGESMPPVPVILGVSATPDKFNTLAMAAGRTLTPYEVPIKDVQGSGLIKDHTLTGHADEKQRDPMAVLALAAHKWKESADAWAAYHEAYAKSQFTGEGIPTEEDPLIVPAFIIQVENEPKPRTPAILAAETPADTKSDRKAAKADPTRPVTQTPLAEAIRVIEDVTGPLPDEAFVNAFGEKQLVVAGGRKIRYLEPPDIEGETAARVVFFKSSLGTGWDCPRAEVLFSFRTAVDPTSIAQTIGRMVRTPLHRRIAEDQRLNSCFVFLPNYDKSGVNAIVDKLNTTGGGAIAAGMQSIDSGVDLALRQGSEAIVLAIEKVPSYIVGRPRRRPEIRTLIDMATFLSSHGIDGGAFVRETSALAVLLTERCEHLLLSDPHFAEEVKDHGEIVIRIVSVDTIGKKIENEGEIERLPASDTMMATLRGKARSAFVSDVVTEFVQTRVKAGTSLREAELQVLALAARGSVRAALSKHAQGRIDDIRDQHGARIAGLSAKEQHAWRKVIREAPTPTQTALKLATSGRFVMGEVAPAGHLFVDELGEAPIKLNVLERAAIKEDLRRDGVVAWLRCVDRTEWALCLAYIEHNDELPFYPDFLVVGNVDGQLRVGITDPHQYKLDDAPEKAKSLSRYARKFAELVGHVDIVSDGEGWDRPRRLHLEREEVRQRLDRLKTPDELGNLYLDKGEPVIDA